MGHTPLMLAHKPEVVQMLLHHSADVYIADEVGWADVVTLLSASVLTDEVRCWHSAEFSCIDKCDACSTSKGRTVQVKSCVEFAFNALELFLSFKNDASFIKIDMAFKFYNWKRIGKSILQVPDTGTRVLDNTRPFSRSSIVSFWITAARSKDRKYHIFGQYWYTKNVPVFTNTRTSQYLGPEVYFFQKNSWDTWCNLLP